MGFSSRRRETQAFQWGIPKDRPPDGRAPAVGSRNQDCVTRPVAEIDRLLDRHTDAEAVTMVATLQARFGPNPAPSTIRLRHVVWPGGQRVRSLDPHRGRVATELKRMLFAYLDPVL